jgi:uncharacterized protein
MMNFKRKAIFTALLATVALVMVFATGCQGAQAPQGSNPGVNNPVIDSAKMAADVQNPADTGLTATGQGKTTMKPDVAYVILGVQTQDANAGKARGANDAAMAKVIAAVKGFGVTDGDITTTNYSIYPTYDDKGVALVGYRVDNTVSVRVKNLDKLGDVLTAASTAGANTAYGINFAVLDQTAAYNDALSKAMDDSKARAEIMAKALGVKLGRVLSINESSSSPGPIYPAAGMAMDSKSMGVPTSSGTVDISASVTVVYEIIK